MVHATETLSAISQFHIALAVGIMAAYLAVPFTALRLLPLTRTSRVAGTFFFLTCAITHLAIAAGFHASAWMLLNDTVQLVSTVVFVASLSRQISWTMREREARRTREREDHDVS